MKSSNARFSRSHNPLALLAAISSCAALMPLSAQATENGGSSYPLGVNTVLSGRLPPPGLTPFVYLSSYRSDELMGNDGSKRAGISDFSANVKAASLRLDYVYEGVSILGAGVESRLALPYVDGEIRFDVNTPRGKIRRQGSASGFGDLMVAPLLLGWASPTVHQMAGVDIFIPTGKYDASRLFNPGRNYWSFGPWYGITAYPLPNLETSAKIIYLVNQENDSTNYRSGNEINIDYNIAYNFSKTLQVGINGYVYKQVSDDTLNGHAVNGNGNRGQVFSFGPTIKYQTPSWGVVAKWQHEEAVENRSRGNRIWFQATARF